MRIFAAISLSALSVREISWQLCISLSARKQLTTYYLPKQQRTIRMTLEIVGELIVRAVRNMLLIEMQMLLLLQLLLLLLRLQLLLLLLQRCRGMCRMRLLMRRAA